MPSLQSEKEIDNQVNVVLKDTEDIFEDFKSYRGAGHEIREAIQHPADEKLQEKVWGAVVPLGGKLKKFYEFSQRLDFLGHDPKPSLMDRISRRIFKTHKVSGEDSPNTSSRRPGYISVSEFIAETLHDHYSLSTSSFSARLHDCKNTVTLLEETLHQSKLHLKEIKQSVKGIHKSGQDLLKNSEVYKKNLDILGGQYLSVDNPDLGIACLKLSTLSEGLSSLQNNLLQRLDSSILVTLGSLLKSDLKNIKGDLRKPFDKALEDYETKFRTIEKEKREHAKQHDTICTETLRAEIQEEMKEERHLFQLQMCEYFLKINKIKQMKDEGLMHALLGYYYAQYRYFQEGLKMVEEQKNFVEKISDELCNMTTRRSSVENELFCLRRLIQSSLQVKEDTQSRPEGDSVHQLHGSKEHGNEKTGYTPNKSDGRSGRDVESPKDETLIMNFCGEDSPTSTIGQHVPLTGNDVRCDRASPEPTWLSRNRGGVHRELGVRIQSVELGKSGTSELLDTQSRPEGDSVHQLHGSKEHGNEKTGYTPNKSDGRSGRDVESPKDETLIMNFCGEDSPTSTIGQHVPLTGNDVHCDRASPEPTWLSRNRGGVHRELGVRIQSVELGKSGTSELLDTQSRPEGDSVHQLHGSKEHGNEKTGYTPNKSDGRSGRDVESPKDETLIMNFCGEDSPTSTIGQHVPLTGNDVRCDRASPEPTWLSRNRGGVHRELGVRIQSVELGKSGTSELLPSTINKERSPRSQRFCHSSSTCPQDKLSLPELSTPPDKRRIASYLPPLPPINTGKGPTGPPSILPLSTQTSSGSSTLSKKRPPTPSPGPKRTLSDPPSPLPHRPPNKGAIPWGPNRKNTGRTIFEGPSQQSSTGSAKTFLPGFLPKLPQKESLKKRGKKRKKETA